VGGVDQVGVSIERFRDLSAREMLMNDRYDV
jgi:hypothetical protein